MIARLQLACQVPLRVPSTVVLSLPFYAMGAAAHAKPLMAEKTASLENAGKARCRLCRGPGLNEDNVCAWLAGDPSKVSRATARRAWRYAESL